MSTVLNIPARETHVVRVFAVIEDAAAPLADEAVLAALGAAGEVRTAEIELFDLDDLQGLPLSDYLAEGHGIAASELAPMCGQLNALSGRVLIVPSRAFGGLAMEMRMSAALRLVGRFTEESTPVRFDLLPGGGAAGGVAAGAGKQPRRQRAALWLAFGFFAILAVGVALVIGLAVKL
ncbi:MAG: hypothetical protein COW54_04290 [Rhodobacteraceae bacterium CG17_big_fil_post_rev_8_21_14_2_50_63_15]|nr:MAG: hypothetical protein COW54_04290 [Rhodobacteraceae bacterium CG17_big_fil_post_rev_8_21_14_2_50_63_15]